MSERMMAYIDEDQEEKRSAYDLSTLELGRRGEDAAMHYLERCGFEIIDRNWTCRFGEVDIVAVEDECLVFIEVKTRRSVEAGLPEEAITRTKQRRYERIAMCYLMEAGIDCDIAFRFDAIGICVTGKNRAVLRHHRACFNGVY